MPQRSGRSSTDVPVVPILAADAESDLLKGFDLPAGNLLVVVVQAGCSWQRGGLRRSLQTLGWRSASLQRSDRIARGEFNRAEALQNDKRSGTVGFALTILQRRLASSPEAIYQSLRRRKERLESRLRELQVLQRGSQVGAALAEGFPLLDGDDIDDLEDAPDEEVTAAEEEVLDRATAARTVKELEAETGSLRRLESLAQTVRDGGQDRKWQELTELLNRLFPGRNQGTSRCGSGWKSCQESTSLGRIWL